MLTGLLLIAALGGITHAENEEDWMPDPYLERAVRENLGIPDTIPIHPADMAGLNASNSRTRYSAFERPRTCREP